MDDKDRKYDLSDVEIKNEALPGLEVLFEGHYVNDLSLEQIVNFCYTIPEVQKLNDDDMDEVKSYYTIDVGHDYVAVTFKRVDTN